MIYKHLVNFWPLVPAVDILTMYDTLKTNSISSDDFDIPFADYQSREKLPNPVTDVRKEINVLIIADGIGCLFKTIARMYRHETAKLNIYVLSCFPESLTRIMLLLSLFTESIEGTGALEKAEMFLEIFGNTFLRASTAAYIETKSAQLLEDMAVDAKEMQSVPMISTELLKQFEKDEICKVLSYLKQFDSKYDVAKAWETSLRAYFGSRYDSRENLFDYLYNMRLSHYPVIGRRNYLEWCEKGMAFRLRKGRYDHPNKTLCLTSVFNEKTVFPDFYCGDIATSPYITFGVECRNESMFEKVNNQYTHSSEDISKFNIIDYMSEVSRNEAGKRGAKAKVYLCMFSTFMKSHRRFNNSFDVVYVSCDMMNCAESKAVKNALKDDGVFVFETIQNVVNSTKEQKKKYYDEMDRIARSNGLKDMNNWESNGCFKTFANGNVD